MDLLFYQLTDRLRQGLTEAILSNFEDAFTFVHTQIDGVAVQVGQTPEAYHSGVFSMIRTLSDTIVLPIAGLILTFVVCYELIQMILERNNMHDLDAFQLYKWILKTFCAVMILSHTFDIVMGVFVLAQQVVEGSAGVLTSEISFGSAELLTGLEAQLETMSFGGLLAFYLESFAIQLCLIALMIAIFVIVTGRMMEIYLTVSLAPIPLATIVNREWGQAGQNYLRSLFALAFQGFLIMVCVAIYAALVQAIPVADNVHLAIWSMVGYTALLCFALFSTGSLTRRIFGAH